MFKQGLIEKSFHMDNPQSLTLKTIESQIKNDPSFVNYHDENTGISILLLAVEEEQYKIVEYLLAHGADPNYQNTFGQTSLHIAIEKCNNKIINLLLEKHADPNIQNNIGDTPMHFAAHNGNYKVIRLLLLYKANPFIKNQLGYYSVDYAKETNHLKSYNILQNYHLESTNHPMTHCMSPSVDKMIIYKGTTGKSSFFYDKSSHPRQFQALKLRHHKSCNALSSNNKFYDLHNKKDISIQSESQNMNISEQKAKNDQDTNIKKANHKYQQKEQNIFLEHLKSNYQNNQYIQFNELEGETDEYTPSPKQISFDYQNQMTPKMDLSDNQYLHEEYSHYPLFTKAIKEAIHGRKNKEIFADGQLNWCIQSVNNQIKSLDITSLKNTNYCINIKKTQSNKFVSTSYEIIDLKEKNNQESNLFYLLKDIHMQQYADCFIKEGFDNLSFLLNTVNVNDLFLQSIGISQPGHRARIAIKLQEICSGFDFEIPSEAVYHYLTDSFINSQSDEQIISLSNWLRTIKMNQYTEHIFNSGYHSVELLLIQMCSLNPLTEEILRNDVHIDKIGYCTRLINKLNEGMLTYIYCDY